MKRAMHRRGFEPLTVRSEVGNSIQLSYRCIKGLKIVINYSKSLDFSIVFPKLLGSDIPGYTSNIEHKITKLY